MWQRLGQIVSRHWLVVIVLWTLTAGILSWTAPPFDSVVQNGEFAFLPASSPSLKAEKLFQEAFGSDLLSSLVVIIASRDHRPQGLVTIEETEAEQKARGESEENRRSSDFEFIDNVLKPALATIAEADLARQAKKNNDQLNDPASGIRINTFSDSMLGPLLTSQDKKATLVTLQLQHDFMDHRNDTLLKEIEQLLQKDPEFRKKIPLGLELSVSGSATVGRDMTLAAKESADSSELLTIVMVVVLLVMIYRAPMLAIIPLFTVAVSRNVALCLLTILAKYEWIDAFSGMNVYVTVVTYGAGVDYCLFLIARYQEYLDDGQSYEDSISQAVKGVGTPLAASALTSIVGIGMMIFADFEKFQQAGIGISMGLFCALCASLTLTPAVLRLAGSWIFWPHAQVEKISQQTGWYRASHPIWDWLSRERIDSYWYAIGRFLIRHPFQVMLSAITAMIPFVIVSTLYYDYLSYGLLEELSDDHLSVIGTNELKKHFPAGYLGPVTVLVKNETFEFTSDEGKELIAELSARLKTKMEDLHLADIRSVSNILGVAHESEQTSVDPPSNRGVLGTAKDLVRRRKINDYYVSSEGDLAGKVTRMDFVFEDDPFSRNNIDELNRLEEALQESLPQEMKDSTQFFVLGPTASIRDLKNVTDSDQIRVNILVLAGVYCILAVTIHDLTICMFLIVSVFFSYLATLGVTFVVFWMFDPMNFSGLDWKVRMFLFTILIAIGEDYNIMLMTRIDEESKVYGPIKGVSHALAKTGSIISSCGVIMAGTFASLMSSSLSGMVQLGFALSFGVMLDTFVVRPLLVSAFMVIYRSYLLRQKRINSTPTQKATG